MSHHLAGRRRNLFLSLALGVTVFFLWSCATPSSDGPAKAPATISQVEWSVENIDSGYWTADPARGHLFYNFWIDYEGTLKRSDLKSAWINLGGTGTGWNLLASDANFDPANRVIGGNDRKFWDLDPDALPLTNLEAELEFSNGTKATLPFSLPPPGTRVQGGFQYVVSVDSTKSYAAGSTKAALARAQTLSAIKVGSTLSVSFTTQDTRVNNGYLWFYDGSHNYLGKFVYFRDGQTGAISSKLGNLKTDGTTNTVTLSATDLTAAAGSNLTSDALFSSAAYCVVVLTDGAQYSNADSGISWDYRSLSSMVTIQ